MRLKFWKIAFGFTVTDFFFVPFIPCALNPAPPSFLFFWSRIIIKKNCVNWQFKSLLFIFYIAATTYNTPRYYILQVNVTYIYIEQQLLPGIWTECADVKLLPQKHLVENLQKDLRPISLTPCFSKVAKNVILWSRLQWMSLILTSTVQSRNLLQPLFCWIWYTIGQLVLMDTDLLSGLSYSTVEKHSILLTTD